MNEEKEEEGKGKESIIANVYSIGEWVEGKEVRRCKIKEKKRRNGEDNGVINEVI